MRFHGHQLCFAYCLAELTLCQDHGVVQAAQRGFKRAIREELASTIIFALREHVFPSRISQSGSESRLHHNRIHNSSQKPVFSSTVSSMDTVLSATCCYTVHHSAIRHGWRLCERHWPHTDLLKRLLVSSSHVYLVLKLIYSQLSRPCA